MPTSRCPSENKLREYLDGRLTDDAAEWVDRHLEDCERCLATLDGCQAETDPLIARLRARPALEPYCLETSCREAVAKVKNLGRRPGAAVAPVSEASPELPAIPAQLGEYQLLESLGGGGMGVVYRARHVKLNRIVALKTLLGRRLHEPAAVARFEREMRAIGQLKHPQIVDAYDAREIDGIPFLVMEYIEGVTLARLCRQLGPLPVADACELVRQAAEGLQYVCDQGLVHRDVKPSNLMLAFTGQVKILDLGLARFLANEPAGEEMTGAGCVMGTVDYIAPEQVTDSHRVDIRADIYSLGCTLYRLINGEPPFAGPQFVTAREKLLAHTCHAAPRLCDVRPDAPSALQAVLDRMLAKRPEERFSRPNEVAAALQPFAAGAQLPALIARFRGAADSGEQQETSREAVRTAGPAELPARPGEVAATSGRPQKRRAFWLGWAALALMLLVSGVVLSVVLRIRRGDQETVVRVPEPSEVTVHSSGEVEVKLPGSPVTESPVVDWERKVALWAIAAGGHVRVRTPDRLPYDVDRAEALPRGNLTIQVLTLWNTSQVRDQDFEMIPKLRNISGVSAEQVPITDLAMPHLAKAKSLQWLTLSDNQITADGLSRLYELSNLEMLAVNGLPVTDDMLPRFSVWKSLHSLFLARTRVTDAGLAHLAACGSLRCLDLHDTAVTDAGLEHLRRVSRLDTLNLEGTRVTDAGLEALGKIPTLRKLDLRNTAVTPAGVKSLRQALPECDVQSGPASK